MKLDNHSMVTHSRQQTLESAMRLKADDFFQSYDALEMSILGAKLPGGQIKWSTMTRIKLLTTLLCRVHECGTADLALQQASLTEPEQEVDSRDGNASR